MSEYSKIVSYKNYCFELEGGEMEPLVVLGEKDYFSCCRSVKFAEEMVLAGPFYDYQQTVTAARDIWFNKVCPALSICANVSAYVRVFLLGEWICFQVDVNGWLEAFAAHPPIGENPSMTHESPTSTQFSFLPLSFSLIFHFIFSVIPRVGKVRRDVLISTLPS